MGNCCEFMESDVRDRHGQPQQGMTLAKNPSKKVHNPFKDKSKRPKSCMHSLPNLTPFRNR